MVECIIFTVIFGLSVIPQLVVAGLSICVYTVICCWLFERELPFSRPFETRSANRYAALVAMLLILVLVAIHFAFILLPQNGKDG